MPTRLPWDRAACGEVRLILSALDELTIRLPQIIRALLGRPYLAVEWDIHLFGLCQAHYFPSDLAASMSLTILRHMSFSLSLREYQKSIDPPLCCEYRSPHSHIAARAGL